MKTLLILLFFTTNLHAQNWKIAKYFPNIQVITMDPDGDRFNRCEQEFAKVGLKPHQYEIVEHWYCNKFIDGQI